MTALTSVSKTFTSPLQYPTKDQGKDAFSSCAIIGSISLSVVDLLGDVASSARGSYAIVTQLKQEEAPRGMTALGLTSLFTAGLGSVAFWDSLKKARVSWDRKEHFAHVQSTVKCMRGACTAAGGILYIPSRILTVISGTAARGKIYAQQGALIGRVASAFFGAVNFLTILSSSMDLYQRASFYSALHQFKDPQEAVKWLRQVYVEKGEGYFIQVAGKEGLSALNSQKPIEEILSIIKRQNGYNLALSSAAILLATLGVLCFVLSLVCTGGGALLALSILSMAVTIGWMGLDAHAVVKAFEHKEAGRYDMLVILLSAFFAFVILSTAMLLTTSFVPFAVVGVVGIIWLVINLCCLYRLIHGSKS